MFLIRWIRFWKGTVEFQISGKFLERFLNLAAWAGIPIWNGKRCGDVFTGTTLAKRYQDFRPLARKTHVSVQVTKRNGLPFLQFRYRKRAGMILGLLVVLISIFVSGQFVWKIQVNGNVQVPTNEILHAAEKQGLRKGVLKSRVDVIKIGELLSVQFDEISWAAVNLIGTIANIDIVERVMPPEMVGEEFPCNVIATRAGQIVSLDIYEGGKTVRVGDSVKEGDVIVSGIIEDKKGRTYYKHARAKAVATFTEEKIIEVPLEQTALVPEGEHQNYCYLNIGSFHLPLFLSRRPTGMIQGQESLTDDLLPCEVVTNKERGQQWFHWEREKDCSLFGIPLPVTITLHQYTPAEKRTFVFSEEKAKQMALQQLEPVERRFAQDKITVTTRSLRGKVENDVFKLTAVYHCQQEIGKEEKIIMEQRTEKET